MSATLALDKQDASKSKIVIITWILTLLGIISLVALFSETIVSKHALHWQELDGCH